MNNRDNEFWRVKFQSDSGVKHLCNSHIINSSLYIFIVFNLSYLPNQTTTHHFQMCCPVYIVYDIPQEMSSWTSLGKLLLPHSTIVSFFHLLYCTFCPSQKCKTSLSSCLLCLLNGCSLLPNYYWLCSKLFKYKHSFITLVGLCLPFNDSL